MTNPWKIRTLLLVAATAAYWLVMFIGTHLPRSIVPASGHTDKLYHFGAFLGLAVLLCFCIGCFRAMRLWQYAGIIGGVACYGIVDELTQKLTHRTADPLDWLADMCGMIVGVLLFATGTKLLGSSKNSQGTTG